MTIFTLNLNEYCWGGECLTKEWLWSLINSWMGDIQNIFQQYREMIWKVICWTSGTSITILSARVHFFKDKKLMVALFKNASLSFSILSYCSWWILTISSRVPSDPAEINFLAIEYLVIAGGFQSGLTLSTSTWISHFHLNAKCQSIISKLYNTGESFVPELSTHNQWYCYIAAKMFDCQLWREDSTGAGFVSEMFCLFKSLGWDFVDKETQPLG